MLHQQVLQHPHIRGEDIKRIVKRDYCSCEIEVMSMLERIDAPEKMRVHAAVLKLGNGNLAKLRSAAYAAMQEYASIVFIAEFPNFYHIDNSSPEKREQAITKDWYAYNRWLKK